MFWPFRRKQEKHEAQPDQYDLAAEKLIAQGVPEHKVRRAARMVKRYAREGVFPDGSIAPGDPE